MIVHTVRLRLRLEQFLHLLQSALLFLRLYEVLGEFLVVLPFLDDVHLVQVRVVVRSIIDASFAIDKSSNELIRIRFFCVLLLLHQEQFTFDDVILVVPLAPKMKFR